MTRKSQEMAKWIVVWMERGIVAGVEVFKERSRAEKRFGRLRKALPQEDEAGLFEFTGPGAATQIGFF